MGSASSMFFFLAFYLCTVVVFLNVLVGFLIDSFNTMQPINRHILSLSWERSHSIRREASIRQPNANTVASLLSKLDESRDILRETPNYTDWQRLDADRKLQRRLGLDLIRRKHAHSIMM